MYFLQMFTIKYKKSTMKKLSESHFPLFFVVEPESLSHLDTNLTSKCELRLH